MGSFKDNIAPLFKDAHGGDSYRDAMLKAGIYYDQTGAQHCVRDIKPRSANPPIIQKNETGYLGETYAKGGFDLYDYNAVRTHADRILLEVTARNMPPNGDIWDIGKIYIFARWIDEGCPENWS